MLGRLLSVKESAEGSAANDSAWNHGCTTQELSTDACRNTSMNSCKRRSRVSHSSFRSNKKIKLGYFPNRLDEINNISYPTPSSSSYIRCDSVLCQMPNQLVDISCNGVSGQEARSLSWEKNKSRSPNQSAYHPTSTAATLTRATNLSHSLLRPAYPLTKATRRATTKTIPMPTVERYKAVMFMYSTYFSSRYGPREAYGSPRFLLQDYPHPNCVIIADQSSRFHRQYTPCSARYKCFETSLSSTLEPW